MPAYEFTSYFELCFASVTQRDNLPHRMSLAELEAAADALPTEEKRHLLEFLASRLNGKGAPKQAIDLHEFGGAIRLPEDPLVWQQRMRGEWA